jgi:hypothetical protein
MHGMGESLCHVQVSIIGTMSFLKAAKKSCPYRMLTFSQQLCDVKICCNKELILGERPITVQDIASNSGISVGSVETVIL